MTTAKKGQKVAEAPTEDSAEQGLVTSNQYPSFFVEVANRRTGEMEWKPKFKYLEGMPKEYRFDGRIGTFGPVSGGGEKKIVLKPIGFRFFEDKILGQDSRKLWGEIFFIDATLAVSSILFHTHSLRNLQEVIQPLFYDDLMLEDVVLTVTSEKMETKKWIDGKESSITYYLAKFAYEEAPAEEVAERLAYTDTVRIYRRQTVTAEAVMTASSNYFDPFLHEEKTADDQDGETSAEVEV